jgi:hypothetical protein
VYGVTRTAAFSLATVMIKENPIPHRKRNSDNHSKMPAP